MYNLEPAFIFGEKFRQNVKVRNKKGIFCAVFPFFSEKITKFPEKN
jgi:hypothetical protein